MLAIVAAKHTGIVNLLFGYAFSFGNLLIHGLHGRFETTAGRLTGETYSYILRKVFVV